MAIVLLGDVVRSRAFSDQGALLRAIGGATQRVNGQVDSIDPLRSGTRDEFHGVYANVGQAVEAALRLRLAAGEAALLTTDGEHEPIDLRMGFGEGQVVRADDSPDAGQSGSAWWAARDALSEALALPSRSQWPPSIRCVYRSADGEGDGVLNATLLCLDQLFARMDLRDRRALRGLLDGERQVDVAAELGITQPAVARRLRDRGALAIKRALESLQAV